MNKREAVQRFTGYLREHNIYYESSISNGVQELTMVYDVEAAPGECIESCIWFYSDSAEVRAYNAQLEQRYAVKASIGASF